ncbi:hypothetical protein [Marinobacterium arenosum]|uniref:hypothetical protein n=1 Tax=Marinobacterium arenosum TaxID=2862496 RepID=UPI001C93832A|nr:hypothetical protein [Marinobacterium arenosum]MBY4677253.1 hypothetical protein [Marinobacterium arenosum]
MDATSIFIIVVSTVLAILFKWVLFRRIRDWMDRDLIRGLAGNNEAKLLYLQEQQAQLKAAGIKRSAQHQQLTELAAQFEQKP